MLFHGTGRFAGAMVGCMIVAPTGGCRPEGGSATPQRSVPSADRCWRVDAAGISDLKAVQAADISVLFVGNSHSSNHDLPDLVAQMLAKLKPGKRVAVGLIVTSFLEDAVKLDRWQNEITTRPWKHVVLQAQKISMSGRFEYPIWQGVAMAKAANACGARTTYFSEWGLRGVAGDGARQALVYDRMAREGGANVQVARVHRAWDLALSERPELLLHETDGNHQSKTGAFLTACYLAGILAGKDPVALADLPFQDVSAADRRYLAGVASRSLNDALPESWSQPTRSGGSPP